MTKQEAIENHRKLWNWIADTSEKENRCVDKEEYFEKNGLNQIYSNCYCCEYSVTECSKCPIKWLGTTGKAECPCLDISDDRYDWNKSEYAMWLSVLEDDNVQECIRLSRIIANLPENPDVE